MRPVLERYQLHYQALAPITSDTQHKQYVAALLEFDKRSRLTGEERQFANDLAARIEKYEKEKYADPDVSPVDVIKELMEANGPGQKDLVSVLGSESAVSMVLSGKCGLSTEQIRRLSERFSLSVAAFF